jgi:ribonuclease J
MAALSRMANGIHKKVQIKPNDTIIFSSHPIPGNEKSVSRVLNELYQKGANVIYQDVHVSGHACQEEIKLIYSLLDPKYAIPVHGEYKHLKAQERIVRSLGYDSDHIFILSSGDVLEFDENQNARVNGRVHTGAVMVDGLGVGDVGSIVLRDRQKLSEDGIIIVVLTMDRDGRVLAGPDIVSRGFVYVRDSGDLMDAARSVLQDTVERLEDRHIKDWPKIKNEIKSDLSDFVWKETQRRPMILPIIMDV